MINLLDSPISCVSPSVKAKDVVATKILSMVRKERLDYEELRYIFRKVRKEAKLKRPKTRQNPPQVLNDSELKKFFQVIRECGNVEHEIMLRLLFMTAIRVSELCNIEVGDVDMAANKIFIRDGKGGKNRYVLFSESLGLPLSIHRQNNPRNKFLFESNWNGKYSVRRIQQIVEKYADKAGIERIHPHLFRHQMLTWLTRSGLSDAQIQLLSGHSSKKSLEVYQHISLQDVEQSYQEAVRAVAV
jgi:integrase/recombinase XerD